MPRTARSFERKKPTFSQQPRTLVLCEDSKSCLTYLREAAHHFRSFARVEIAHCGNTDPKGIVREAIRRRLKFERVYCAIDRDSHHGFVEALALASTKGVEIVASFPCYEFWLLLHFEKTRAPFMPTSNQSAADQVSRVLRSKPGMNGYNKGDSSGLFAALLSALPAARQRASEVLADAIAVDEMNPSTRLHMLIDELETLGKPQKRTRLASKLSSLRI